MVAQNITLPNIRKLFIPDPGHIIVDCDQSGADAQVVAWEADDQEMKDAFRAGLKLHAKNARDLFPDEYGSYTDEELKKLDYPGGVYHDVKRAVHASNYGGKPPTIAATLKWKVAQAVEFQNRWFYLHPGIPEWHERTERHLDGRQCWQCNYMVESFPAVRCKECDAPLGSTVRNAFGYRRRYFDRIDGLLPQALAWIPQSTVAINTTKAMILLEENFPFAELLLQVHDSIVFQVPQRYEHRLPEIKSKLNTITTPYPDPLRIPWGMAHSQRSWGDCG